MNGYEILNSAAKLAGFQGLDENLKITGLALVNTVIAEMGYLPISSLSEDTGIASPDARSTLITGTAMLISGSLGDTEERAAFSKIFCSKLATLKGKIGKVKDVLPKGDWE